MEDDIVFSTWLHSFVVGEVDVEREVTEILKYVLWALQGEVDVSFSMT